MLGEANAVVGSAEINVAFVFGVEDGYVTMISGFSFGEPWPGSPSEFRIVGTRTSGQSDRG